MCHDIAIYVASAATTGLYDRAHGRSGGAERQMTLLARALADRGRRVAHVTYEPRDPVRLPPFLTLVYRRPYRGQRRLVGGVLESLAVWEALRHADARTVILRTASPMLGVAALFCLLRRRRLVFSSSNVSDFTLEKMRSRLDRSLYAFGMRRTDAVVVQSRDQIALARARFPRLRQVELVPSMVEIGPEPARAAAGGAREAFLWYGRAVPQKQPERYVDLARTLPRARFRMIAVADGGGALAERLRTLAQETPNLELLDPVPHAELQEIVARSVAVVNTSTLEGMPNAFLEAWACGVPVLTLEFDPDRVVELRRLGVSAGGSWERFAEGARRFWETRHQRGEFAERARRYLDEVHAPQAVAARWDQLLDELDGGRDPAAPTAGEGD